MGKDMKSKMKPRLRSPSARDQNPTPKASTAVMRLGGTPGATWVTLRTIWAVSSEIEDVGPVLISIFQIGYQQ